MERDEQEWAPGRPSQRHNRGELRIAGDATTGLGVRQVKSLHMNYPKACRRARAH